MTYFDGVVLYVLVWWTVLFAVLPFGTHSVSEADPQSGWRGTPARPYMLRKIAATTIVSAIVWIVIYLLIKSPFLSFRDNYP